MRPCRQCRAPIENNVATCPQCGTVQDGAPKPTPPTPVLRRRLFRRAPPAPAPANPDSPPRRRSFVVGLLDDLTHPDSGESCFVLLLLVVLGAAVGGALAGGPGVLAGIAGVGIALILAAVIIRLLSSSEG